LTVRCACAPEAPNQPNTCTLCPNPDNHPGTYQRLRLLHPPRHIEPR
jgi:hypothetical protein